MEIAFVWRITRVCVYNLALLSLRQEDCQFNVGLCYIVLEPTRLYSKCTADRFIKADPQYDLWGTHFAELREHLSFGKVTVISVKTL